MYKEVADSGDVVIQKRGISIVDTREPTAAILLSPFGNTIVETMESHRNRIFPIGLHQGVHRFVSPGLRHVSQ
jgi:hypothetical protein